MPRQKKGSRRQAAATDGGEMRLQRFLASAGFGSRRGCEELIVDGRVEVDDQIVTELGTKVDPYKQKVKVDGTRVKVTPRTYYLVNKPTGVVSTHRDPQGRPRVIDLVPDGEQLFPVGRLDMSSEGLILLTNDGELAQRLAHPRYGVEKIYHVTVAGELPRDVPAKLCKGVRLAEGIAKAERARIRSSKKRVTELEIVLREGKNREIRRMLAGLGHKVQKLRRIAFGPLRLGDVPPGAHRPLTKEELERLSHAGQRTAPGPKKRATGGSRGLRPRGGPKRTTKKRSSRSRAASDEFFDLDAAPKRSRSVIGALEPEPPAAPQRGRKRAARKGTTKKANRTGRPAAGRGGSSTRRVKKSVTRKGGRKRKH